MSQIYPNFSRPDSALGGPAQIQAFRVKYTVTSSDHGQGFSNISVALPFAFADTNYTIHWAIEQPEGAANAFYIGAFFGKTANGFNVVTTVGTGLPATGDVLTIHVTAIHD